VRDRGGTREAKPILLEGLKQLEYRGYDAAGVAIQDGEGIYCSAG
jgi:glucosamine--fructose-6-phosphate aminotransferase (isomerizing)